MMNKVLETRRGKGSMISKPTIRILVACVTALCASAAPLWAQPDSEGRPSSSPTPKSTPKPASKPSKLDNPKDVFGPASKSTTSGDKQVGGWTIVVAVFRGEDQAELAKLGLNKVQTEGGLPEAFIEKRGQSTVVATGHFSDGSTPEVAAELKRVQEIKVGTAGQRPYMYALLAPPINKEQPGSLPQYNLSQARVLFGDNALYTLQVGVYGREDLDHASEKDLAEARAAAEQAALRLRQEGEMAFYHHGPRRSMVTVGVFDTTDFDPSAPTFKSARLLDAMKRHPNNLYNGAGIKQKIKGQKEGRLQPSTLVAIPKDKPQQ